MCAFNASYVHLDFFPCFFLLLSLCPCHLLWCPFSELSSLEVVVSDKEDEDEELLGSDSLSESSELVSVTDEESDSNKDCFLVCFPICFKACPK